MLFNSLTFAIFLPIVFGIYWLTGKLKNSIKWQNILLLIASYIFYGWWDARFLILIFISSLSDFLWGILISREYRSVRKKVYLWASILINLGMLGYFKYANFFIDSLYELLGSFGIEYDAFSLGIVLPVGISFYTFQTMSYTLDIYNGKIQPTRDVIAFFAFVSFFPQLVAGPIERAKDLVPQFLKKREFQYSEAVEGLQLILWGMIKKVVIADRLGEMTDYIYGEPGTFGGLDIVLATIFFGIQIYCDFSGYSDIAIGVARLFGFRLSTNFVTPYFSSSLREFWNRWHITLNTWFRDYVFIPLGGSRKGPFRLYFNVFAVFLLSGLWHGPAWTFVLWGALHASWYSIEKLFKINEKLPSFAGVLLTNFVVFFGWIFFRARSWESLKSLFHGLSDFSKPVSIFTNPDAEFSHITSGFNQGIYVAVLLSLFFALEFFFGKSPVSFPLSGIPRSVRWLLYYSFIAILLIFGAFGIPRQFIYFQF